MAELVKWSGGGGIAFYIKQNEIRGVKDLNISVSADTEDKTTGGEKFIKKKNSGGYQITLTAVLNAALGVDVQGLAVKMAECARNGNTGYFYTAGAKLFPSSFMCTDAKIGNVQMTSTGKWSYCEVAWTLKQCSKYNGTTSSSSSSSSKKSSSGSSSKKKTSTPTKTSTTSVWDKLKSAAKGAVEKVKTAVKTVTSTISSAKKASTKAYSNLTTKKTTGGSGGGTMRMLAK